MQPSLQSISPTFAGGDDGDADANGDDDGGADDDADDRNGDDYDGDWHWIVDGIMVIVMQMVMRVT